MAGADFTIEEFELAKEILVTEFPAMCDAMELKIVMALLESGVEAEDWETAPDVFDRVWNDRFTLQEIATLWHAFTRARLVLRART